MIRYLAAESLILQDTGPETENRLLFYLAGDREHFPVSSGCFHCMFTTLTGEPSINDLILSAVVCMMRSRASFVAHEI